MTWIDFSGFALTGHHVDQEGHELFAGMTRCRFRRRMFELMLKTASGERSRSELHGCRQQEFEP